MQLIDIYLPLFTRSINALTDPECQPDELRGDLLKLIENTNDIVRAKNYSENDIELATSAIFIYLDEMILCSDCTWKEVWRKGLLQSEAPCKALGGILFFEYLSQIDDKNYSLRLIYLFCLFLGYKGRYIQDADNTLNYIINNEIDKLPDPYKHYLKHNESLAWNIRHEIIGKNSYLKKITTTAIILSFLIVYLMMNLFLIL